MYKNFSALMKDLKKTFLKKLGNPYVGKKNSSEKRPN